jgi:hypothetical protein
MAGMQARKRSPIRTLIDFFIVCLNIFIPSDVFGNQAVFGEILGFPSQPRGWFGFSVNILLLLIMS